MKECGKSTGGAPSLLQRAGRSLSSPLLCTAVADGVRFYYHRRSPRQQLPVGPGREGHSSSSSLRPGNGGQEALVEAEAVCHTVLSVDCMLMLLCCIITMSGKLDRSQNRTSPLPRTAGNRIAGTYQMADHSIASTEWVGDCSAGV